MENVGMVIAVEDFWRISARDERTVRELREAIRRDF